MPYTKEEFAEAMRQPGSLATAPYPLGSKRLERQTIWKEGDPLPEPKTIPDNPEHDASRNDYIRLVTENNRLVQELHKLRQEQAPASTVWKPLSENLIPSDAPSVRAFDTGATRSSDAGRYDPEGFLSPIVIERFCEYMQRNRVRPDGSTRASDNWQAGIPIDQYMKGAWRHFLHLWTRHRGYQVMDEKVAKDMEDDLCALLFNVQGMLFELLKEKRK